MIKLKGRIVSIKKVEDRITYVKRGVKEYEQNKYSNYNGGCGTYVIGGEYLGTEIQFKVFVYDLDRCITVDLRPDILSLNNKKRISKQSLDFIVEENKGKKVTVYKEENEFKIKLEELNLIF